MTTMRNTIAAGALVAVSTAALTGCSTEDKDSPDVQSSKLTASTSAERVDESSARSLQKELGDVGIEKFTAADYKPGKVKHIVLFRFKQGTSLAKQAEVMQKFRELKGQATRNEKPYIVSLESGTQTSGEGAGLNMKQGFIVTFASEGDRNYYVGTPIVTDAKFYDKTHQSFKEFVGPLLDKSGAVVLDFTEGK
ncbi:Dabb family protein [Streptomyces sp. NPDC093982]|uniref:Dabb family protein n=1 Tax=Streptomyces sp. NPDC093982 TaxID=3155077 RepID=UPI003421E827